MLGVCKDLRVILRQAEFADITGHFLGTKLWLCRLDPGDPLITDHHRCQVRIREVTVILCIFLGTHSLGTFLVVIPTSCFLNDLLAIFDQLDLASCFPFNGMCNSLKRVDILHLSPGAKFRRSHFTDRYVYVSSHGTFLKLTVRSSQILDDQTKFFQICDYFLCASHIRFRNDLDQRYTASVVIYQGAVFPLVMDQLSCILFHVDLMDTDLFLYAGLCFDLYPAIVTDRQVQL